MAQLPWACSSVVEHCVDIAGVASSILATPTIENPVKPTVLRGFCLPRRVGRFRVGWAACSRSIDRFWANWADFGHAGALRSRAAGARTALCIAPRERCSSSFPAAGRNCRLHKYGLSAVRRTSGAGASNQKAVSAGIGTRLIWTAGWDPMPLSLHTLAATQHLRVSAETARTERPAGAVIAKISLRSAAPYALQEERPSRARSPPFRPVCALPPAPKLR